MLQPLPQEYLDKSQAKKAKKRRADNKQNGAYRNERKRIIDVSQRLKVLGSSPERFPLKQLKVLLTDTKSILFTIRRIELNGKLKSKKQKRKVK